MIDTILRVVGFAAAVSVVVFGALWLVRFWEGLKRINNSNDQLVLGYGRHDARILDLIHRVNVLEKAAAKRVTRRGK